MGAIGAEDPSGRSGSADRDEPRRRLIEATLDVIAEQGVRGLSHRRVAKAAGVSLGSANYHFGTLDNLTEAAFVDAIERDCAVIESQLKDLPAGTDLLAELATILHGQLAEPSSALTQELLVAALSSERLRPLARTWADHWKQALLPFLGDELTASVAVALTGGIVQLGLMSDPPMTVEQIEAHLRRGLAPG